MKKQNYLTQNKQKYDKLQDFPKQYFKWKQSIYKLNIFSCFTYADDIII